jgi:hypothetical protein
MLRKAVLLVCVLIAGLIGQVSATAMHGDHLATDKYWLEASDGRKIDAFTQKGGKGPSATCPPFILGEEVILYANVTYNEWPIQSKDVTFQVVEPNGDCFFISGRTNASGIAKASFLLPKPEQSQGLIGTWAVTGSVEIREVVVSDTVEFYVCWDVADVNQDLKVDIYDVIAVCAASGSTPSSRGWNPRCDIALPYGVINIVDVVAVTASYGRMYSTS